MFRMIVKTQSVGTNGRSTSTTEHVGHIPADQIDARREAVRTSAPRGAIRTIRVIDER